MALKTKQLECPFTWEIEKQWAFDYDEVKEPTIQFEDEPLLALMTSIMITYIRAVKEEFKEAFCNIKVTDDIWEKLDKSKLESIGVSTEILLHIKAATEYFLYHLAKYDSTADHTLQSLKSSELFQSDDEVATIDGCKSVAWSCFHEKGHTKSAEFAKLASLKSPNCSLWHYILGKSLRLSRRNKFRNFMPLHEEQIAFIRASELSNTPFYKIRLAQMYCKKNELRISREICLEILAMNHKSSAVLFRLTHMFMTDFKDFKTARICLDQVRNNFGLSPNLYFHIGQFHSKQREHRTAAEYFKKASEKGFYKADLLLARSMQKVDQSFDFIEYLKMMVNKYYADTHHRILIFLHIGMHYIQKEDNMNALDYFLRAIEVDPECHYLQSFMNSTLDWKVYNIYDFVRNILREWHYNKLSNQEREIIRKLKNYCAKKNTISNYNCLS